MSIKHFMNWFASFGNFKLLNGLTLRIHISVNRRNDAAFYKWKWELFLWSMTNFHKQIEKNPTNSSKNKNSYAPNSIRCNLQYIKGDVFVLVFQEFRPSAEIAYHFLYDNTDSHWFLQWDLQNLDEWVPFSCVTFSFVTMHNSIQFALNLIIFTF